MHHQIYQRLGYHVLAFDYRGYGDSSYAFPDEDTMAEDAIAAFRFATDGLSASSSSSASLPKVVVHGHSLGTAVTARMAANLKEEGAFHFSQTNSVSHNLFFYCYSL